MSNEIMQENIPFVECSAFHRGMSVLEASLRNTEDSEAIISGLLKGAAEFYDASRASVVEADWDLGIGVITYEWCKDGVPAQRDMLQCLPMEKFPRWRKALRANKPVVISDLQRLEKVYPDEAAFFREYGVTTLLAAPFSKRINQGFIAVDDPTRYTDDPVFLFIASYAVVAELNEIKQQQSLLAATKASKYNPEDIHINFFGGMEIISSKGTLTGEDIKADQCYLLLAYLILNHKKNFTVDTLAEIICPYDELDSPYKVVNNIVYRLRRSRRKRRPQCSTHDADCRCRRSSYTCTWRCRSCRFSHRSCRHRYRRWRWWSAYCRSSRRPSRDIMLSFNIFS